MHTSLISLYFRHELPIDARKGEAMKDLISCIAKALVDQPEQVSVSEIEDYFSGNYQWQKCLDEDFIIKTEVQTSPKIQELMIHLHMGEAEGFWLCIENKNKGQIFRFDNIFLTHKFC